MNSLVGLLPIAITGLVGVVAGFYFVQKEQKQARSNPKNRRAADRETLRTQVSSAAR
jgi:uncharacterized protein YneF (UPF0154 family)